MKVGIIGAGTMGSGIAQAFAQTEGYEVYYIGSKEGMEKEIVARYDIPYTGISSGKLRRYAPERNSNQRRYD